MPIREAASRSISIATCGAAICWSEATSCSSGSFCIAASTIGAHWFNSALSVSVSVYWYWVRLRRPPMLMSCPDCMKNLAPCTCATFGRSRWMTWSEVSVALVMRLQLDEDAGGVLGRVVGEAPAK